VKASRETVHPVATLLALLDEAYDRPAWHGPNLKGAVRRVRASEAARQPARGRHSVWELAVHAAYWKYAVLRRLTGAKRGSFPLQGSNWFGSPSDTSEKAWKAVLALLEQTHRDLRAAVAALPASAPARRPKGSKHTISRMVAGAALHDVYHAGQIQLVKRFVGGAS
jgi:uncharacterized damage-inducible protein DinB